MATNQQPQKTQSKGHASIIKLALAVLAELLAIGLATQQEWLLQPPAGLLQLALMVTGMVLSIRYIIGTTGKARLTGAAVLLLCLGLAYVSFNVALGVLNAGCAAAGGC
jgi:hypothetical protein